MAGSSRRDHGSVPNRWWSAAHPETAPGTVALHGPRGGIRSTPSARTASAVIAAGARPAALSTSGRPAPAGQYSAIRSPPIPFERGSATVSAAATATAASAAVPPAASTSTPIRAATGWVVATMPPDPVTGSWVGQSGAGRVA
jgi:hypothetical protein